MLVASEQHIARYEMKYVVDVRLRDAIRDFVLLFCKRDRHADPVTGEYTVSTLFFDSYKRDCYLANENKSANRFKLRARTYGNSDNAPLFLEIKRRVGEFVDKSRAALPPGWSGLEDIILGPRMPASLPDRQRLPFYEFEHAFRLINARPVLRVRYDRESFMSENDAYARVTFDRRIRYQPTRGWDLPGSGRWRAMDSTMTYARDYPAFILELKCTSDQPSWMAELIERFNLVRTDFCKYATATRLELLHCGFSFSDAAENCTY
ncbi:MAG: VTC domain-containing protein [Puniceicoccaceae bacterium]